VVSRVHLKSGELTDWRELGPVDTIGVNSITGVAVSADEKSLRVFLTGGDLRALPGAGLAVR